MQYYTWTAVRSAVKTILETPPGPSDAPDMTVEDRLVNLISTVSDTCYSMGRLEVQNGVIDALGLRHLLGVR